MKFFKKFSNLSTPIIILFTVIAIMNLSIFPATKLAKENLNRYIENIDIVVESNDIKEMKIDENMTLIIEDDLIKVKDTKLVISKDKSALESLFYQVYITTIFTNFLYYFMSFILLGALLTVVVQMLFKFRMKFKLFIRTYGFSVLVAQLSLLLLFVDAKLIIFIENLIVGVIFTVLVHKILKDSLFEYMYYSKEYE